MSFDIREILSPNVNILFQDETILALDKPAGLLSHPSLFKAPYSTQEESFDWNGKKIYLLHRLDRETSGVLLCAYDFETAKLIKNQFKAHKVKKTYHALVTGIVEPKQGVWKDRIPKEAITKIRVIKTYREIPATYLELSPETGRTNQLRIQTSKRHWPILGDRSYGNFHQNKKFSREYGLKRMFLHAAQIEFFHPSQKKRMNVSSPISDVLLDCLRALEGGSI